MSILNRVVDILPYGRPDSQSLEQISEIDYLVQGTKFELQLKLFELEDNHRNKGIGDKESWNHYRKVGAGIIPDFNESGYVDIDKIVEEHRKRMSIITSVIFGEGIKFEDGNIKSKNRIEDKMDRFGSVKCLDLSRCRLICNGLDRLNEAYNELRDILSLTFKQIGFYNHYSTNIKKKYLTPFRGVLTNWSGFYEKKFEDNISTEIQLVTKRVRLVMDLNHPFDVSQIVQYPDEEARDFVYSLLLKASILDFQELKQTAKYRI